MTGRVWHFGEHSAWVVERAGTPYLVRFPKRGDSSRRIVRQILHRTPDWQPECEEVASLVRWLAGCDGAVKPSADLRLAVCAEAAALAQDAFELERFDAVLAAREAALAAEVKA